MSNPEDIAVRLALLEQKMENLDTRISEGLLEIKEIAKVVNFAKGGWKIGLVFTAGLVGLIDLGTKIFLGFFQHGIK